jgi:hypothetical protein
VLAIALALGELPRPIQGLGIDLALAGIAIISCDPAGLRGAEHVRPSVVFGLLTALGFGGFLVGMDAASEGGVAWAVTPRQFPLRGLIGILVITADALYAIAH